MTRVPGTWIDKGHYFKKAAAYTALAFLFPFHLIVVAGEKIEGPLDHVVNILHMWMRPCIYKDTNDT